MERQGSSEVRSLGENQSGSASGKGVPDEYVRRSRQELDNVQTELKVLRDTLTHSRSSIEKDIGRLCDFFEGQLDNYLLILGYLIQGLRDMNIDTPTGCKQFRECIKNIDWDSQANTLRKFVSEYETLPSTIKESIEMPILVVGQMATFCAGLSRTTAGLGQGPVDRAVVKRIKVDLNGALKMCVIQEAPQK